MKAFIPQERHFTTPNSNGIYRASEDHPVPDLQDILADEILPAVAWYAARSSSFCRWPIELLDVSGRMAIRSLQDMTDQTSRDNMGGD